MEIREGTILLNQAELYYREIGQGPALIILHGGPDFDHNYLLPEMDRLSDAFRLIYYDQRGRGKSARNVKPEDVSMESEIADLDGLRAFFGLDTIAILGHSWGGVLAMEYALRHPRRVSHLVLMNTAPASHADYMLLRQERRKKEAGDIAMLEAMSASPRYQEGDLEADAEYYRIHFGATLRQPEQLERVVKSLRVNFTKTGILLARKIEDLLMAETWLLSEYDLLPGLEHLAISTLIIHGEDDLVPVDCAVHIAQVIPGAHYVLLKGCGHFSFLERPAEVYKEIVKFV